MKTKLKQNGGFAIISVIIILFVLSLMGTAMYAYTVSSMRSIRFASERKKAEYLAKSGVEVAAYAYQTAINEQDKTATGASAYKKAYAEFIGDMASLDQIANSSQVHLSWDKTNKKYVYQTSKPTDTSLYDYVGYFTVKIQTKELEFTNPLDTDDKIIGKAKQFVGTGVSGKNGARASASGFLPDSSVASAEGFYTSKGYIQYPKNAVKTNSDSFAPYSGMGNDITVDVNRAFTTRLFQWLTGQSYFTLTSITIKPFAASSAGNFILDKPSDSDTIKFYPGTGISGVDNTKYTLSPSGNYCNSVVFAAGDNLFLKSKLDVTPARGSLNAISLVGKDIVIDGNIEMYVYCLPDTSNQTLVRAILTTAQKGFGIGKVIIGAPVTTEKLTEATETAPATYSDPKPAVSYIDPIGASFESAGKVYFGGNVTVTVEIANEGKHRYRVFNAGDVYYFDVNATIKTDVEATTTGIDPDAAYGIDLLQYFLEKATRSTDGRFSEKTKSRFRTILKFYYSTGTNTSVSYSNHYLVGSKDPLCIVPKNQHTRYNELVPPTPFGASNIIWDLLPAVSSD